MLHQAMVDRRLVFLAVGALNTGITLLLFAAIYLVGQDFLGYVGALAVAYPPALLIGFVLQRRLVFRVTGRFSGDLIRYVGVQAFAFATNAVVLSIVVELAGIPVIPAQVVSLAATVTITYVLHSRFTFHRVDDRS